MKKRTERIINTGKIPEGLLKKLLRKNKIYDPRVLIGPKVGEDAAVVGFGRNRLVVSTDPITFASEAIGWYVVNVNANDVAVMGARPKWFLCTMIYPKGTSSKQIEGTFRQVQAACSEHKISLIGGHAEITTGIDRILAIGTMLGEADNAGMITSSGARVGEDVVLAGEIAIEGTALLAREFAKELESNGVSRRSISNAKKLLFDPGISVVNAALSVCKTAKPSAMHDPTEGGLATGIRELADASNVGIEVYEDKVPIIKSCAEFCRRLDVNPLGLIASGSLLITSEKSKTQKIITALKKGNIPAVVIGKVLPKKSGSKIVCAGKSRNLPKFARDEIARLADS